MSIDPDDPGSFARWLVSHGDAPRHDERDIYPRRLLFGEFVSEAMREICASQPHVRVTHDRAVAIRIARSRGRLTVETRDGTRTADAVALATGNPTPTLPAPLQNLGGDTRCIADPWAADALDDIPADARVLIVGTGLTMGDAVVGLRARGHTGEIVATSRRGRLPHRGLADAVVPFGDFRHPARTASELLVRFKGEVRRAQVSGLTWHSVLLGARVEGWKLWDALPLEERSRFVRHLRHFYEIHRHVMPGPVADHLADERSRGTLVIRAGRLKNVQARVDGGFDVDLTPRGASPSELEREQFDVIVNCTGPSYGSLTQSDPLWSAARAAGLVRPDPVGFGIETDTLGRAIDHHGDPAPDLFVLGTLARFAFGELTGVREISAQARRAAETLLSTWSNEEFPALQTAPRQTVLEDLS